MKTLAAIATGLACTVLLMAADLAGKSASEFTSVETRDLHNAYRVTDKLISGAAPETEQAFKDLKAIGVVTILSVDGAKPDVDMARKYGMRYVHLPITYSTVKESEGRNIAKALSELAGPIYLHCHHGKHRSAAAVAVGCVMNGSLKPDQAESVLKTFGTGENYTGLWKAAREAKPLDEKELAAVKVDYVEQARIPEFAEQMVSLDMHWAHLKAIQKNDWKAPKDHPDLDPAHEALQLQEHLRESARGRDVSKRTAEFRRMLGDGEQAAESLHKALSEKPANRKIAEASFKRVGASCITCHEAYRD